MATKRRNLYLYLTLACFFGLIAIFIIDGYMGIYDTIYITAGEREQKIEADVWLREETIWSTGVNRGDNVFVRYEVANRRFPAYASIIEASVWHSQEKVLDLTPQQLSIAAFGTGQTEWTVDTARILPDGLLEEQGYEYTLIINRGDTERRIILYISLGPNLKKPVPAPSR
ncbi:hypothetical protein ACFLVB_03375 [Chloroflexota bacterium]